MFQNRRAASLAAAIGALAWSAAALGQADVIVGDLRGINNPGGEGPRKWGTIDGVTSYSIGTTSCNIGDVPLDWFGFNPNHPVIAQHFFRVSDGRIQQIGQSWVKHGLCALQEEVCGDCTPFGGGCEVKLGVGCSDPYSSSLNGDQAGLGPASEVNAFTGEFDWPYGDAGVVGDTLYKRIQVDNDDLSPDNHPDAVFLAEGHYVAKDDAAAGNGFNNASYRRFTVGSLSGGGYFLNWAGTTQQQLPGITAWQDHGLGAGVPDPDVHLVPIDVPDDGQFWLGYKVSDNGDGTWHYEYAIHNINSHRAGASLTIPVPSGVLVTDIGFADVDYHSGEPFDPTNWNATRETDTVVWESPQTYDQNPDSNALRWGTLYNFWFDADAAPVAGNAQLGLFRPGKGNAPPAAIMVPGPAGDCVADFNADGNLNILDFVAFQGAFTKGDEDADVNADGDLNILDFIAFQELFQAGC
jgi:hypothetical protein